MDRGLGHESRHEQGPDATKVRMQTRLGCKQGSDANQSPKTRISGIRHAHRDHFRTVLTRQPYACRSTYLMAHWSWPSVHPSPTCSSLPTVTANHDHLKAHPVSEPSRHGQIAFEDHQASRTQRVFRHVPRQLILRSGRRSFCNQRSR